MRKQIYFSNALDKELLAFIEKQSSLSRSLALGMQILYEIFGNVDLKEYLPPGFEANSELVTYEKLLKKAGKALESTVIVPSNAQPTAAQPNIPEALPFSAEEIQKLLQLQALVSNLPMPAEMSNALKETDVTSQTIPVEVKVPKVNDTDISNKDNEPSNVNETIPKAAPVTSIDTAKPNITGSWEDIDPDMEF